MSSVLYGCDVNPINRAGAVIPHHLLVEKDIDAFYKKIADETDWDVKHVVLISPNHFAYGHSFIQTTNVISGEPVTLALDLINTLNSYGAARIEPSFFGKEHGIFVHYEFIQKYFPDAGVTPFIIKRDTPKDKLDLFAKILEGEIPDNTLIIASIDFTHFEPEDSAKMDDERTTQWLSDWSSRETATKWRNEDYGEIRDLAIATYQEKSGIPDTDPVAIDSPESLYVMTRIFENFVFEKRTSSALILKTTKPVDNTTHIFGKFL